MCRVWLIRPSMPAPLAEHRQSSWTRAEHADIPRHPSNRDMPAAARRRGWLPPRPSGSRRCHLPAMLSRYSAAGRPPPGRATTADGSRPSAPLACAPGSGLIFAAFSLPSTPPCRFPQVLVHVTSSPPAGPARRRLPARASGRGDVSASGRSAAISRAPARPSPAVSLIGMSLCPVKGARRFPDPVVVPHSTAVPGLFMASSQFTDNSGRIEGRRGVGSWSCGQSFRDPLERVLRALLEFWTESPLRGSRGDTHPPPPKAPRPAVPRVAPSRRTGLAPPGASAAHLSTMDLTLRSFSTPSRAGTHR